jgi:hypothetical protein
MSEVELVCSKGGRLVVSNKQVDIYHQDPLPVYNFTSIDNYSKLDTLTSGSIIVGSFVASGIDLFNRDLGGFGRVDFTTSGIERYTSVFDIQYKRSNIAISGTKNVGRF